jgi:hypothetical protein
MTTGFLKTSFERRFLALSGGYNTSTRCQNKLSRRFLMSPAAIR